MNFFTSFFKNKNLIFNYPFSFEKSIKKILSTYLENNKEEIFPKLEFFFFNLKGSEDISLLNLYLPILLSSNDFRNVLISLRYLSYTLNFSNDFIHPFLIENLIKNNEKNYFLIKYFVSFINPLIYLHIKSDLIKIFNSSNIFTRSLIISLLFQVYKINNIYLDDLIFFIKNVLFDSFIPLSIFSILSELSENNPKELLPLTSIFLSEILNSDKIKFQKICIILTNLLKIKRDLEPDIESVLQFYLTKNNDYISIFSISNILKYFKGNSSLFSLIGSFLENLLNIKFDINLYLLSLNSIFNILKYYIPNQKLILSFINHNEILIKSISLKIINYLYPTDYTIISEFITTLPQILDPLSINLIFKNLENNNNKFINTFFIINELNISIFNKPLIQSLYSIKDNKIKNLFLQTIRDSMLEPPIGEFGLSIANVISLWSNNPDDISLLLSPMINQKPEYEQEFLIDCSIDFYLRLKFKINKGIKNRIKILKNSNFIGVRQRSSEFIFLFK